MTIKENTPKIWIDTDFFEALGDGKINLEDYLEKDGSLAAAESAVELLQNLRNILEQKDIIIYY